MIQAQSHSIGRQRVHIRYKGGTDALALRGMISDICRDELPARLNELLERYDRKDHILHIDQLSVSLSLTDDGTLRERLVQAMVEQIEAALRLKLEQDKGTPASLSEGFIRALKFYLDKGVLPRWSLAKDSESFRLALHTWFETALSARTAQELLKELSSPPARRRFLALLSEEMFTSFVISINVWSDRQWKNWTDAIHVLTNMPGPQGKAELGQRIKEAVLIALAEGNTKASSEQKLAAMLAGLLESHPIDAQEVQLMQFPWPLAEAFQSRSVAPEKWAAESRRFFSDEPYEGQQAISVAQAEAELSLEAGAKPKAPEEESSILIANAGLVIAALYLPNFFKNLGLIEDKKINNASKAVALLRHLVFEDKSYLELEAVLEKLLCGIPLSESIATNYELTRAEKEECNLLLQSIIEHWAVLKNTTPAGLRYNFLVREGALTFKDAAWELKVQKQAQDILLDYLPWGIGMIKLPWMKHLIMVKWNV